MTNPTENNMSQEPQASEPVSTNVAERPAASGGPLNLEQIRRMREAQQAEAKQSENKPLDTHPPRQPKTSRSGSTDGPKSSDSSNADGEERPEQSRKPKRAEASNVAPKVQIPNVRGPLSSELEEELEAAFSESDLNKLLVGDSTLKVGLSLEEGQRYTGRVIKIHNENVFISLGGPDEGVVPLLQFHNDVDQRQLLFWFQYPYREFDNCLK